ncbi:MAG: PilN domain-containing protein [Candidatus Moduliflexus flocculans]|nr:PilN domain-containing protein [Candidatus Moduliflexus flocculans]
MDKFKKDKKELEQKLGVIADLRRKSFSAGKDFRQSGHDLFLSKDIWLIKITQKGDQLTIEGVGRDNIVVADFMKDY